MEPEFAVHDETGNEGLDAAESALAPVSVTSTFKRDQHSGSYSAKKAKVIDVPMV